MKRSFLDVCSGHLSPGTWAWLDARFSDDELRDPENHTAGQLAGGRTRYGWFVYAPEDPPACPIPDDLAAALAHARRQGCEYALFDRDAPPSEGLPVLHPGFADSA